MAQTQGQMAQFQQTPEELTAVALVSPLAVTLFRLVAKHLAKEDWGPTLKGKKASYQSGRWSRPKEAEAAVAPR